MNHHVLSWKCAVTIGPLRPSCTCIYTYPKTKFSSCKHQFWFNWVLHKAQGCTSHVGIINQPRPGTAKVLGMINIRRPVMHSMVIYDHESLCGIVFRRLNLRNPSIGRKSFHVAHNIVPGFTSILSYLNIAIICTYPNNTCLLRAWPDCSNGSVIFSISIIVSKPS